MTLQRRRITARPAWIRSIAVLLVLSVIGCTTAPVTGGAGGKRTPYHLPSGAKVALAEGDFGSTITLVEKKFSSPRKVLDFSPARGIEACRRDPNLKLFIVLTLGLGAIDCPLLDPEIGFKDAVTETSVEKVVSVDKHVVHAQDGVAAHKAAYRKLERAMESQSLQRWFVDQSTFVGLVRRYATQDGVPISTLLPIRTSNTRSTSAQDKGAPSFVFEVAVTALRLSAAPQNEDLYAFAFYAQGQLVRVSDNTVVDAYVARMSSDYRTMDEWTAEDGRALSAELQSHLPELATALVELWIDPVIETSKERGSFRQ